MKNSYSKIVHRITIIILLFILSNDISAQLSNDYSIEKDIFYHDSENPHHTDYMKERCLLDIYYPANEEGFATVIWFHGGGLKGGNKFIPERLMNQGIAIVAVNYRFYPKIKCPAYIQDAAAAVAWVFNHIEKYSGDPDLIVISGHSAGGYLTSMVGLDKSYLQEHDIDANRIASLVPFSGHTITHMTVREERGISDTQPIIDKYAPLFHVGPDAPALILITGDRELELLGRYEENAYMMRMMKVAGHKETTLYEIDGYGHGMTEPAYPLLLKEVNRITKENEK
jgi:dienelactone hydrolase